MKEYNTFNISTGQKGFILSRTTIETPMLIC